MNFFVTYKTTIPMVSVEFYSHKDFEECQRFKLSSPDFDSVSRCNDWASFRALNMIFLLLFFFSNFMILSLSLKKKDPVPVRTPLLSVNGVVQ